MVDLSTIPNFYYYTILRVSIYLGLRCEELQLVKTEPYIGVAGGYQYSGFQIWVLTNNTVKSWWYLSASIKKEENPIFNALFEDLI